MYVIHHYHFHLLVLRPQKPSNHPQHLPMGSTGETQITPTHVNDEEANLFAMQLASASVLPMILKSALELDLLEIIAKAGPNAQISPSDIAAQIPTKNPDAAVMLDRMMRLLACYNVLTCSVRSLPDGKIERLYGLAPVAKYLVKNEDGVSIAPLNLMNQDKVLMESWYISFLLYSLYYFLREHSC